MTTKEQLYYLLEHYMIGDYDTHIFTDQFSDIFDMASSDELIEIFKENYQLVHELAHIANWTSCYRSDYQDKHFFKEYDVRKKTIEVCKKLGIEY